MFKSIKQNVSSLLGSSNMDICIINDSNNQGLYCVGVVETLKFICNIEMKRKKDVKSGLCKFVHNGICSVCPTVNP